MRPRVAALFWTAVSVQFACAGSDAQDASEPVPTQAHLPAGIAVKVGGDEIAMSTVAAIARAQNLSLPAARELAVRDAALAAGARAAFAHRSIVPVVERGAWARALLEQLKAEAVAQGAANDAEVAELTALRWQEFDRPETVRVSHAVAIVAKPEQDAAARAIAQHLYEALRNVQDPQEFVRIAQTVAHEGVDVRAEHLPALTRDGRSYYPEGASQDQANQRFDKDFAEAAHRLAVGQVSEPSKSIFGYHVILCEARLPENHVSLEERRRLLADEVLKGRAERSKQELLARLSASTPVLVTRSLDDLTARVQVVE